MVLGEKILGLNKNLFTILMIIVAVLLFAGFCLYACSVFVKKDEVLIVERNGRYHKTIKSGWHFYFPLLDNKVKCLNVLNNELFNKNDVYVQSLNNLTFQINFCVVYNVNDPKLFFYHSSNPELSIERIVSSFMLKIFSSLKIEDKKDISSFNFEKYIGEVNDILKEIGVASSEISLTSIR